MGLFKKRKSRATRRGGPRDQGPRQAGGPARRQNEARRIKATERAETKAIKAQLQAQRDADRAAVKVAETQLKAAREGRLLSPPGSAGR